MCDVCKRSPSGVGKGDHQVQNVVKLWEARLKPGTVGDPPSIDHTIDKSRRSKICTYCICANVIYMLSAKKYTLV